MTSWDVLPTQSDPEGNQDLLGEITGEIRFVLDRWSVGQLGLEDLAAAGIVLGVGLVIAWLTSRLVRRYARRLQGPARAAAVSTGIVAATGVVLTSAALALEILGFSLGPVLVLILVAIVILLLARPLLTNLSSGLVVQLRGGIEAGALVHTHGVLGTVHEVNARSVVIDTTDGRRVHVPNTDVAVETIENYTELGRRRSSFELTVDHRVEISDLVAALADAVGSEPAVLDEPEPEIDLAGILGRFVIIRVLVWHGPGTADQRHAVDAAVRAVVTASREAGIELEGPEVLPTSGRRDPPTSPANRR